MRKKQTEIDYDELINRKKKEIAELKNIRVLSVDLMKE